MPASELPISLKFLLSVLIQKKKGEYMSRFSQAWVVIVLLAGAAGTVLTQGSSSAGRQGGPSGLRAPERGTWSARPAGKWEESLISGNGRMGAMVMGQPLDETIIISHEKLFLPWERPLPPVDTASHLVEIRKMISEGNYQQAADYVVELSKKEGYSHKRWTDPFIPAFDLRLIMKPSGGLRNYSRSLDFETGVVSVAWEDGRGAFLRRLFVSRPDNVVVLSVKGPGAGRLDCLLGLGLRPTTAVPGIDADYWNPEQKFKEGIKDISIAADGKWLTYQSSFNRTWPGSLQGYEGVAGVMAKGGKTSVKGKEIFVSGADELLVLIKVEVLKDVGQSGIAVMKTAIEGLMPAGFDDLLASHTKAHNGIFERVRLDLGGGADRGLTTEELVAKSRVGALNKALLEKEFDFCRYAILSSSGDWPPALQGIWTGTWGAPWSGDYTQNGNVQAAIASELSGNMAECMISYFDYMDSMLPEFRETAKRLYGTRGIHVTSRQSSHGLNNHFDATWPMTFWTAGAAWTARFYFDYWLFTGDRTFLTKRAVPFMKEAALFYEDFLFEGKDGKYIFSPSYSPENDAKNTRSQSCVNATMDISLAKELLANLVSACQELGIDQDGIARWNKMLAKMPAYRVNPDGAIAEWIDPNLEDNYGHRHASHLVGLYEGIPPDVASDPKLVSAFQKAIDKKMEWRRGEKMREMAFGLVQLGQAATSLGDVKTAYQIVDWLANDYWTPALTSTHDPKKIFNVDICGGLPAVIIKMLLCSQPGQINLLPVLPAEWGKGIVTGLPCRGQVLVKSLGWEGKSSTVVLRSGKAQDVVLSVPGRIRDFSVKEGRATVRRKGGQKDRRQVSLPAGQDVRIEIVWE